MSGGILRVIAGVLLCPGQGLRRLITRCPEIYQLSQHLRIAGVHTKRAFELLLRLVPLVCRRSGASQSQGHLWIGWRKLLGLEKLLLGSVNLALTKIDRTEKQTFRPVGRLLLTGLYTKSGVSMAQPTGIELVDGQSPRAISRKTGAFTAGPIDRTLVCDTTSAGFTATLPDADVNAVEYVLKNVGANALTVATTSSQLIYTSSGTGATTATVTTGQTLRVQALYNGTSWGWYAV